MNSELRRRFPAMAYIDPTARVHGAVEIGEGSSLWPYSVIRAEGFHVRIGRCSNLQDHVMVHVGYHKPTIVGDHCSITHRVVLHGCTIGDNCLIGIGATIMEGVVVGENSIVAGHSYVADNMIIPPNSIVMGTPAKVVRTVNNFVANYLNSMLYRRNALCYAQGDHRGWDGPEFEAEMRAHKLEAERRFAARYGASAAPGSSPAGRWSARGSHLEYADKAVLSTAQRRAFRRTPGMATKAERAGQHTVGKGAKPGTSQRPAAKGKAKAAVKAKARAVGKNPFLAPWATPFEMPAFDQIRIKHFLPAITRGFAEDRKQIEAIAKAKTAPTFANTIEALERSGETLERAAAVFFNLAATDTNKDIQALERTLAPRFAKHSMAIYQNPHLFRRVDALMRKVKDLSLSIEQMRVLERYHRGFVRAGAALKAPAKRRLAAIAERMSKLGTAFAQNLLADEQAFVMVLESEADLAGLPDSVRAALAQAASDHGHAGKHAVTLARSTIEPFLHYSSRRDLREKAFKAWTRRGANGGKTDNRKIVAEILALRAERARLLGYKTAADAALEYSMAKTPDAVRKLLMEVWGPGRARALEERDALQAAAQADGGNFKLAAWDWRYFAEKVRKARFDIDEAEIKPYLQLDNVIAAAFDVAGKLFGLTFAERTDLPLYHPEVRTFEVRRDGDLIGLFIGDYFARPSKHSGAWCSGWRRQQKLNGDIKPIVVNVMNFAKAAPGEPALLSMEDARTLFHEFGHGLHALLSNVTYPSVAGTAVERDFVELPSQLYEHWFTETEVLSRFARHHKTGKPVPPALIKRLEAAQDFNQGFKTVEYLAAAIVDLDLHTLDDDKELDVDRFESKTLQRIGMPEEIVMRHRIPHFQHIMGGYAAGYYSYLWSEVMDADAFRAFKETGNIFDPGVARRLYDNIYSAGGRRDAAEAYTAFRGRLPAIDALLEKRGLATSAT